MKKLSLLAICLLILTGYSAEGANWKFYGGTKFEFVDSNPKSLPRMGVLTQNKTEAQELYYYDRESLIRPSKDIVKVWTKEVEQGDVPTPWEMYEKGWKFEKDMDEKAKELKDLGIDISPTRYRRAAETAYFPIKETMRLQEIKCGERMIRTLEITYYDKNGAHFSPIDAVSMVSNDPTIIRFFKKDVEHRIEKEKSWQNIKVDSIEEALYKSICR
jgi:hypothetical protein